jgi:pyridoxal phosphate-dependent aminotransferase EpsN
MGDQEREFVAMAFESNWIAPLGPNVDAFEKEMAAYAGVTQAAATVSGTAAIHLALRLLDVGPKDVVLCSTLTFVASAFPILYQGARPVFVDSEPSTWNMSPEALERAFADLAREGVRPKAVIVVNLYGQSADYERLLALCRRWGVPLVEDAAESLGATYRDRASGTLGDMGIFSFNGNKIITTSGGGMLVSNNAEQVERARFLSTQARDPRPWYEHSQVGYNYRMSNVLAGIGRGQLKVLGDRVQARRDVFDRYVEGLKDVDGLSWMSEAPFGKSTRWLSVCLLDPGRIRATPADVIARLSTIGIETRHVWKPMHRQPIFQGVPYYPHEPGFSFSDMAFEKGICFPSGSNLSRDQQNMVIDRLRQVLTP